MIFSSMVTRKSLMNNKEINCIKGGKSIGSTKWLELAQGNGSYGRSMNEICYSYLLTMP